MVRVYFEYGNTTELVATFETEELYGLCVEALDTEAKKCSATLTESILSNDDIRREGAIEVLGYYISSVDIEADFDKLIVASAANGQDSAWDYITPWQPLQDENCTVECLLELIHE